MISHSRPRRRSRYALLAAALTSLLVTGLDLADPDGPVPSTLRSAGAAVTGPLLEAVAQTLPEPADHAADLAATSARLALTESEARRLRGIVDLDTSATLSAATDSASRATGSAAGATGSTTDTATGSTTDTGSVDTSARIVTGRVVGVGTPGASGLQRLTIDLGSRDGIAVDQSVLSVDGLIGRTVRVGATTSDVLVLGAADLVVGVRTESGLLGTLGPPTPADAAREVGQLTFTAIGRGDLTPGEPLTTVGSPDDRPFVAGIPVGTIASVDPAGGRVGAVAAVSPAADVTRLDVVAVVVPTPEQAGS